MFEQMFLQNLQVDKFMTIPRILHQIHFTYSKLIQHDNYWGLKEKCT